MHPLDFIRFEPEKALVDELFARFSLEAIVLNYEQSGEGEPARELVLSTQLRLTPLLAPRLCRLFEEVKARLLFEEPVELFVQSNSDINGFSLHSLADEKPHIVSLTSGMIERMNDDELRFVLGHELGHLHFRHHRPRLVYAALATEDEEEDLPSRIPPLLQRRMESWERLAELSADRAGFVAIGGRLEPVVSSFFKLTSGLGPEHLNFDIQAFLHQLGDLMQLKRREVLAQFSHPATPVRVRALQLYGEAGGGQLPSPAELAALEPPRKKSRRLEDKSIPARESALQTPPTAPIRPAPVSVQPPHALSAVEDGTTPAQHLTLEIRSRIDAEVSGLAQLMDFEVTEALDIHARDFLISAGMLAVHAGDGDMSRKEHELLVQLLLPLTADPEALFERVGTEEAAEKLLKQSAAWLRANAGEERFVLFRQIAHLVAVDGVLDPEEKEFMLKLAKTVDIPAKAATKLVYEVLADYLQSRPWDRKIHFRTRTALKKRVRRTRTSEPGAKREHTDSSIPPNGATPAAAITEGAGEDVDQELSTSERKDS